MEARLSTPRILKFLRSLVLIVVLSAASAPALASPMVYELGVDGLGCPFCAYGVEKQLNSVEGVEKVDVHIERAVVVVTMDAEAALDEDTAKQAVEDAGFSLRSFEQVAEK